MRKISVALLLAAATLIGVAARADVAPTPPPRPSPAPVKKLSAAEILAKVDHAINAFKDAVWECKLRVKENGTWREMSFTTYQKSPKRMVRFTGGDQKGMNVLVESPETIYVYLPEFKRVRRMGTHVNNQQFGGSDFSSEDMSQTSYAGSFEPKLVGEDAKSWILELTAKSPREFPKTKMWVDKEHFDPVRMDYLDASGKVLKTEERSDFKQDSPTHWQPGKITLVDHRRNDHTSEIVFLSSKIDTGLPDDLFTVRSIQR